VQAVSGPLPSTNVVRGLETRTKSGKGAGKRKKKRREEKEEGRRKKSVSPQ
jgi:hypothetical protein